ncbi:adenine phosphoribosyltransferase [bacterium]|nr:adenine phosphoribosyltransferase [bacterium]MBR2273591.1 adenine phosphoribosyltransferase [Alphaproteobacteria bacterium]
MTAEEILSYIRNVPDFPKEGILFKDITTAIKEPKVYAAIIDYLAKLVKDLDFDYIAAIESRGYIIGAPLAYKLNKGLIIIRKPGKLPAEVVREDYSLEYGVDSLEMHKDAVKKGDKVLVVDDLLATGGTAEAACKLVKKVGADVIGCLFLLELVALSQNADLPTPVYSLIKC